MSNFIDWPDCPNTAPGGKHPTLDAGRAVIGLCNSFLAAPIAAVFTPLGVLSRPSVRRILLAVAILNITLPFGDYIGNREFAAEYGALDGFRISLTTIALAGLYLPLLVRGRTGAEAARRRSTAGLALGLYFLFCSLSLLVASDVTLGLYEIFLFLQLVLFYFYIVHTVTSRKELVFLFGFLLIGLAVEGLVMAALAGGLANLGFIAPWVRVNDDSLVSGLIIREISFWGLKARVDQSLTMGVTRLGGTIGSPNDVATYLSMAVTTAVASLAAPLGRWYRRLAIFGIGSGVIGLIYTFSRGAWIALVLGLGILGGFGLFRFLVWRISRRTGLFITAALLAGVIFLRGFIGFRFSMDDRGSAQARGPLNQMAFLMIEDHPLFGVGANNFPVAMQPYITRGFAGEFLYTVHNRYLLMWSETGLGSLVTYVWFLLATLCIGWRCWRYRDPLLSPLALGCTAALAGHMFHMFWEPFRGQSVFQMVFLLSALLVVMERLAADRLQSPAGLPAYARQFSA